MEDNLDREIKDGMKQNIKDLAPLIFGVVKDGMTEGEKKIDHLQLDAAKLAQAIIKTYYEYLLGKPVEKHELSGKDGEPVKINWVFKKDFYDNQQGDKDTPMAGETS